MLNKAIYVKTSDSNFLLCIQTSGFLSLLHLCVSVKTRGQQTHELWLTCACLDECRRVVVLFCRESFDIYLSSPAPWWWFQVTGSPLSLPPLSFCPSFLLPHCSRVSVSPPIPLGARHSSSAASYMCIPALVTISTARCELNLLCCGDP